MDVGLVLGLGPQHENNILYKSRTLLDRLSYFAIQYDTGHVFVASSGVVVCTTEFLIL